MRILILGGTQFVGRQIAETLHLAGHRVTVLNRGQTPDALPASIERLRGDRDARAAGLSALGERTWDACVDVSGYLHGQVRASVDRLVNRVAHYVFVSAVSVYGHPTRGPVDESAARLPPAPESITEINGETYGPLKVACEDLVQAQFRDRCTILRPQIVVGPHDPDHRYASWIARSSTGRSWLAPGDGSDYLQVIDVRDVACFVLRVLEHRVGGVFNLAGERLRWSTWVNLLGAAQARWVPAQRIRAAGVTEFELPLYRAADEPRAQLMNVSAPRAIQAGLTITPHTSTIEAHRNFLKLHTAPRVLDQAMEAALLASGGYAP